jgi:hypothetical protein
MNIFKLLGEIAINNQGAIHAINDTNSRAHALGENMGKVFTAVGNGAIKAGKVIGTGLAAGATAMTGLVVKGMNLLSGLEQNLGGSEAVFGEFADRMQKTAAQAYSSMGLSQSAYLATANKMGSLFKGAGFATVEAVELTEETMQRAADVASIMGIDIEHAMESIAGAAKGNFTMMDNLGVAINDTNLKEYALSKGIRKTTQEMTTQEKVALAMQMFMEKTAYAAGNYAKENETLAGALTTAKAAFQNFLAGAGSEDEVASALENAATVIGKKLNVLLPKLSQGVGGLIKKLSPRLPGLMKDMLPGVIDGAVSMMTGLASALPGLLSAVGEVLPGAFSRIWEGIRQTAPVLLNALKGVIESVDFTVVGTAIGDGIKFVIANIPAIMTSIGNALSYSWKNIVWPVIKGLADSFGTPLSDAILDEWEKVKPGLEKTLSLIIGVDIQFPTAGYFHDKFQDWIAEMAHLPEANWFRIGDKSLSDLMDEYNRAKESGLGAGSKDKSGGTDWDNVKVIEVDENGDPTDTWFGGATGGGATYEKDEVTTVGGSRSGSGGGGNRPSIGSVSWFESAFNSASENLNNVMAQMNNRDAGNAGQIISLLSAILAATNRPIYLDSGALVGAIGGQMNAQLGRELARTARR